MHPDYSQSTALAPVQVYPPDRTVGSILLIFAAIGIPLSVVHSLFSVAILGFPRFLMPHSSVWAFHGLRSSGGWLASTHGVYDLIILCGLVYAGYAMSRSRRQAFVVALVIGIVALSTNVAFPLALGTTIYAGLRLFGRTGPTPV